MAYLMGFKVSEIRVFPHETYGYVGDIESNSSDNPSSFEEAEKSVCVYYAAEAAEIIKYGSLASRPWGLGVDDKVKADELLKKYLTGDDKEKQKHLLREHAKILLNENWSLVEVLTNILVKEDKCFLSGEEIVQIICDPKMDTSLL